MPMVEGQNPKHQERIGQWTRQRDAIGGDDRIKEKTDVYLPRLSGQVTDSPNQMALTSYDAYLDRALFMNATARTQEGLAGAIMRKEPQTAWPESKNGVLDHAGRDLESFLQVTQETLDEVIGVGRHGHLVDMPQFVDDDTTPFIATYSAESIEDWAESIVKGKKQKTMVKLFEPVSVRNVDGEIESKPRWRILRLDMPEPDGEAEEEILKEQGLEVFLSLFGLTIQDFDEGPIYFQEVWEELETSDPNKKQFTRVELHVPRLPGGVLWREIPFTFINPQSTRPDPEKPPIMDLTVVNISHYRNSADLEHGLHFTALPQPYATGTKYAGTLFIGSEAAWMIPESEARVGYLEFTGEGLGALVKRMEEKKKEMASLGARLLESQQPSGSAEAFETVKLRHAGENSILARISMNVSEALSEDLRFMALFMALPEAENQDKIGTTLNTDFGVEKMTPEMLNALMLQVQAGFMSWNTYFWNIKRDELVPEEVTEEEEAERIDAGPPTGVTGLENETDDPEPEPEPDEDEPEPDEDEQ